MQKLFSMDIVEVRQKKEWLEILSGFEGKNRYVVKDSYGNDIYLVGEKSSFWARIFLQFLRSLELHIINPEGIGVLKIIKPFRFFFYEARIEDFTGKCYGKVKRIFSFAIKDISVETPDGVEYYRIKSSIMHPWTLKVYRNGQEVGEIVKKWSGIGKEMFTDADNFTLKFPSGTSLEEKVLLLGALFFVDLVYFEGKN